MKEQRRQHGMPREAPAEVSSRLKQMRNSSSRKSKVRVSRLIEALLLTSGNCQREKCRSRYDFRLREPAQGIGCIRTNVCEKCQPSIHRDREFTFSNTDTDRFGYTLFH